MCGVKDTVVRSTLCSSMPPYTWNAFTADSKSCYAMLREVRLKVIKSQWISLSSLARWRLYMPVTHEPSQQ